MGRHRSSSANRGISKWPVLALVGLLALAAIIFGWLQLREHNENNNTAAAASCFDGDRVLAIAADPAIAQELGRVADTYNDTHPVIRDQCVAVEVQPRSADDMLSALGAQDSATAPAVWVAQSAADLAQVRAQHPDAFASSSRSIASSPVLLAVPEDRAAALGELSWGDLPGRQASGDLRLALPGGEDSGATTLALAAVIAAVTNSGDAPLTAEQAASAPARAALAEITRGAAGQDFASTAMALSAAAGPDSAQISVPTTEQQLYLLVRDQQDPSIRGLSPAGDTPVADYPATALAAAEADETLSRAASAFIEFARQPDQLQVLADAGFQVPGVDATAPANGAVTFSRPQSTLPTPDAAALTVIAPLGGEHPTSTTTVLLDVSGSMREVEGGRTRLINVTDALRAEIAALPGDAAAGLWRYSANLNGSSPYSIDVTTGALDEQVEGGDLRRQHLDTALGQAVPVSSTYTYRSLEAAYASAVEGFRPGQVNSVLLITDGPNDDQSYLDSGRLLAAIAAAQDPTRPVAVDVIVISPNPDLPTLQSVADQTGGTLTLVDSGADPRLADAISSAMG